MNGLLLVGEYAVQCAMCIYLSNFLSNVGRIAG